MHSWYTTPPTPNLRSPSPSKSHKARGMFPFPPGISLLPQCGDSRDICTCTHAHTHTHTHTHLSLSLYISLSISLPTSISQILYLSLSWWIWGLAAAPKAKFLIILKTPSATHLPTAPLFVLSFPSSFAWLYLFVLPSLLWLSIASHLSPSVFRFSPFLYLSSCAYSSAKEQEL